MSRIHPEEGLSRQRDRSGHQELCRSIQKFGVLTPITVREDPNRRGHYLLVKGQGRTLACRLLGIERIPADVVDDSFGDSEKVQQFLVENIARQKMSPVDRALLIVRARRNGEETRAVAERFGVTATTVRRLVSQINGATEAEVAALQSGQVSLAVHAVLARWIKPTERASAIAALEDVRLSAKELDLILQTFGWHEIEKLQGEDARSGRAWLLGWACRTLAETSGANIEERICKIALQLPLVIPRRSNSEMTG